MNVKQDDTVLVIAGKDRGKKGKVREVRPRDNKVIVEGINIVKKHTKGRAGARQNVRVCRHCGETFETDANQNRWGGRR